MDVKFENGNLIITVPYAEGTDYRVSDSGKSKVVATSGGFQAIDGAPTKLKYSVNVIESIPKKAR